MVALREGRHIASDPLDDPGTFVAQQGGMWKRQPAILRRGVGVADPRGHDPHHDLVVARIVNDKVS